MHETNDHSFPRETEEEWADLLTAYVADTRPRVFALMLEHGDREDAIPVAWGMVHPNYVDVAFVDGTARGRHQSIDSVKFLYCRTGRLRFVMEPSQSQDVSIPEPRSHG